MEIDLRRMSMMGLDRMKGDVLDGGPTPRYRVFSFSFFQQFKIVTVTDDLSGR